MPMVFKLINRKIQNLCLLKRAGEQEFIKNSLKSDTKISIDIIEK